MSQTLKKDFIGDVIDYIKSNRVFDLLTLSKNQQHIIISNLGKIEKNLEEITFLEKDCFGFWQKVPFLKAPFTILNQSGVPLADSGELKNPFFIKQWVNETIFEIVRHVVQQFFSYGTNKSSSYEFFLIKEIVKEVYGCNDLKDQQLLSETHLVNESVINFHTAIKDVLIDDALVKCVSEIRDHVTLFEYTFSLPNKRSFIRHGQNWVNLLPTLALSQQECLLLSRDGKYDDRCEKWLEISESDVNWKVSISKSVNEYTKKVPVASLRALIGKNISHSLAIMQKANISPLSNSALFSYVGKIFNNREIFEENYQMYAYCLEKIVSHISKRVSVECETILEIIYDAQVFENLLKFYRNGQISAQDFDKVFLIANLEVSLAIQSEFESLVSKCDLVSYKLQDGNDQDYVTILENPKSGLEFDLYEKCLFLMNYFDLPSSTLKNLKWWYIHVSHYRVLVCEYHNEKKIHEIYSMKDVLSIQETQAIKQIMQKIENL